jgi:large subunit ribosomal protein L22
MPVKICQTTQIMEVAAKAKYQRISAFKAREVTREIQGKPASTALDILAFSPKKAARLISKTLKSAIANAENNNNLRVDTLVVKEAIVGEGPTIKRIMARARGSASPIRKRTSHITITVTDDIAIETRESKKAARVASGKDKPKSSKKAAAKAQKASEPAPAAAAPEDAASSTAETSAPQSAETKE